MSEIVFTKTISIGDLSKICRTCLGVENLFPIFDLFVDNIHGTNLLQYSVDLDAISGDNLPENICETCLKELWKIYKFKRQCHENDAVLKLLVEENSEYHEEEIKIQSEELNQAQETPEVDNDNETNIGDKCEIEIEAKARLPYQCNDCLQTFEILSEFRVHRYTVHNCKRVRPCKVCNKLYKSNRLTQHMRTHTKEKPYQCNICSRGFSSRENLTRHQMIHTGERPYVCSMCGEGFIHSKSLVNHEKTHACQDTSITHQRIDSSSNFNCGHALNKKITRKIVKRKFPIADSSRKYVCEICARAYKSNYYLKMHMMTHGEIKFICKECGRGFYSKLNLQSHMRVHTGEKPHKCGLCDKSFSHSSSLQSHLLIHTGDKPYACSQCTSTFRQRTHLIYHMRTHTGEKPYVCKFCKRPFAFKKNLTVHERRHTGDTPYVCPVCKKKFNVYSGMKTHIVKKHSSEDVPLKKK